MTKKEMIREFIILWMNEYEIGTKERKNIYIKLDYLINKIDRENTKYGIEYALHMYAKNNNIHIIIDFLLGAEIYDKIIYNC